jgi:histidinol dehydrogenase
MIQVLPGLLAGERFTPIESAGLYVPRGRGNFPSMLYMMAVPAVIAEVPRICIATPPGEEGVIDPACLYAARLCGVTDIIRVGGAHAVGALAFGTESIDPVAKIVGPGSLYVTAAKRLLYGTVDVGLPAGPSESIILADDTPDPRTVALDLLIEAEHGSDSQALLITPSRDLAEKVAALLPSLLQELPEPRRRFAGDVLTGYGGIITTESIDEAADIVNRFAPEHLQVRTEEPFDTIALISNAGEILLGENIPFSVANYAAGPNAVLPTGGTARTYSPVSVRDFQKSSSVVYATSEGYRSVKDHVVRLAEYEGFSAHANALTQRRKGEDE